MKLNMLLAGIAVAAMFATGASAQNLTSLLPWKVTVDVGVNDGFSSTGSFGFGLSRNLTQNLAVEGTYDHAVTKLRNSDVFATNVTYDVPLGRLNPFTKVTPYVLAGVGYGFSYHNEALVNAGVGVRYDLNSLMPLDFRWRHEYGFGEHDNADVFTAGIGFRF